MEAYRYKADDGLSIPAYLTRPDRPQGAAPLVVMVHGGPWVRDHWEWDDLVQLLAAHGYAVFQPQFRGSSGFGKRFEQAGVDQWGLGMQDDITAGVRDLVDRGIADPARICIYGANYGGYAAMWGLAKTPQLYRCGISFAGVSDLYAMLRDGSDRARSVMYHERMAVELASRLRDRAQLDAVSPLRQVDRIVAPLLIAHGESDQRVPISHSRKMAYALKQADKPVETLYFPREGHGFSKPSSRMRFYSAVLEFLDRHIGDRRAAAAAASKPTAD